MQRRFGDLSRYDVSRVVEALSARGVVYETEHTSSSNVDETKTQDLHPLACDWGHPVSGKLNVARILGAACPATLQCFEPLGIKTRTKTGSKTGYYLDIHPPQQSWLPFPMKGTTTLAIGDVVPRKEFERPRTPSSHLRITIRVEREIDRFEIGVLVADWACADLHSSHPVVAVGTDACTRWYFVWYRGQVLKSVSVGFAKGIEWVRELLLHIEDGSSCACPASQCEKLVKRKNMLEVVGELAEEVKEDLPDDPVAQRTYLRGCINSMFDSIPSLNNTLLGADHA